LIKKKVVAKSLALYDTENATSEQGLQLTESIRKYLKHISDITTSVINQIVRYLV
jgi:hypothetical protein